MKRRSKGTGALFIEPSGQLRLVDKSAEQQAFERLEVGFQLVSELTVRQQHSCEESTERHRESHLPGKNRHSNNREQCGRSEYLGHFDPCYDSKSWGSGSSTGGCGAGGAHWMAPPR